MHMNLRNVNFQMIWIWEPARRGRFGRKNSSRHFFADRRSGALAPHLIAAYAIAYSVGFLSIITPSGFGVREGALYLLLVTVMDPAVVTVAALAMRFWTMIGEVTMAILATVTEPHAPPAPAAEPVAATGADMPNEAGL